MTEKLLLFLQTRLSYNQCRKYLSTEELFTPEMRDIGMSYAQPPGLAGAVVFPLQGWRGADNPPLFTIASSLIYISRTRQLWPIDWTGRWTARGLFVFRNMMFSESLVWLTWCFASYIYIIILSYIQTECIVFPGTITTVYVKFIGNIGA